MNHIHPIMLLLKQLWTVAENPRTPIHILEKFSNDEDSYIREAARENLKKKEVP